jgi:hypothetical protein
VFPVRFSSIQKVVDDGDGICRCLRKILGLEAKQMTEELVDEDADNEVGDYIPNQVVEEV